jgi:hypothetical protein
MFFRNKLKRLAAQKDISGIGKYLWHKNHFQRITAIRILDEINLPETIPYLLKALRNENDQIRELAFHALINKKSLAIPTLIEILKKPYDITEKDRENVLEDYALFLESVDNQPAQLTSNEIDALLTAIKQDNSGPTGIKKEATSQAPTDFLSDLLIDREIKWKTAEILGEIGEFEAVPVLIQSLKDEEHFVRSRAARALGKIGDLSAVAALEACQNDRTIHEYLETALHEIKAVAFARRVHSDRPRNFPPLPYLAHLRGVAKIVKDYYSNHDVIACAYLHDVLEHPGTTYEELVEEFGVQVADLVLELTNDQNEIRRLGKIRYLTGKFNQMSDGALIIKLAERLDNLSRLKTAHREFFKKYAADTQNILKRLSRPLNTVQLALIQKIKRQLYS